MSYVCVWTGRRVAVGGRGGYRSLQGRILMGIMLMSGYIKSLRMGQGVSEVIFQKYWPIIEKVIRLYGTNDAAAGGECF